MRKLLLFLPMLLLAKDMSVPLMPPMPPMMNFEKEKKKEMQPRPKKDEKKSKMPKECEIIPPMLIFMPPPLEKDLIKCKNKFYFPKKDTAQKKLSKLLGKKVQIKSIDIVEGFEGVYKIVTNKEVYYCNKNLNKCFRIKE